MLNDLLRIFSKFIKFLLIDENAIYGILFLLIVWVFTRGNPNIVLFLIRKGIVVLILITLAIRWKAITYLSASKLDKLFEWPNINKLLRNLLVNNSDVIFGFIWGALSFFWLVVFIALLLYEVKTWNYVIKRKVDA